MLGELVHALGQPLTVLGGCRLLARMPQMQEPQSLEDLADQVDRAREIYEAIRLLLEGVGAERIPIDAFVSDWTRRNPGNKLQSDSGHGDGAADSRILEGVVRTTVQSSWPATPILLQEKDGWLEIHGGDRLPLEVPWMLRVALAAAESEEGEGGMVYKLQPFHARVRLHPV